jgi:large subunit ribosomal protein L10
MPSTQKIERVAELKEQIEGSEALLLTEYRGLAVSEITELRSSLREGGARFAVIKNTLMKRALEQTDASELGSLLDGPSAMAFVREDPVAAAKSVTAAAKKFPALILKGGFVEGRLLSADQAKALADLDTREVMLSKLAGMMKSEMSRAAAAFQATQARFLSLLEAFKAKLPEEPESAEVAEAPSAEAAPPAEEPEPEAEVAAPTADAEAQPEPEAGSGTDADAATADEPDASTEAETEAETEAKSDEQTNAESEDGSDQGEE